MKLFSKKGEQEKQDLPPLKFPEFPKEPKIPSYKPEPAAQPQAAPKQEPEQVAKPPQYKPEPAAQPQPTIPEAKAIKQAISQKATKENADLEIPIRKPAARQPIIPAAEERLQEYHYQPERPEEVQKRGQTLFVQIDRYKEAMARMENIKDKIIEAENVLKDLEELKLQENDDLIKWHQDLDIIKNKILAVDKTLFEE